MWTEPRGIRTPNLRVWNPTRYHCAIGSVTIHKVISKLKTLRKKTLYQSFSSINNSDTLAEWLRRRPAKPLGFAREGSNPSGVVFLPSLTELLSIVDWDDPTERKFWRHFLSHLTKWIVLRGLGHHHLRKLECQSFIWSSKKMKKSDTFSICACHPCAGAMLIFSVSFQFLRMTSFEVPAALWIER